MNGDWFAGFPDDDLQPGDDFGNRRSFRRDGLDHLQSGRSRQRHCVPAHARRRHVTRTIAPSPRRSATPISAPCSAFRRARRSRRSSMSWPRSTRSASTTSSIEVDGAEMPIMDGSSAPFIEAIEQVGIVSARRQAPLHPNHQAGSRRGTAVPGASSALMTARASKSRSISTAR